MQITFLIGNGFDLNLGLDTRYSDFVKTYTKGIPEKEEENEDIITCFKRIILKEDTLWSSAEEAFGKLTAQFKERGKNAEEFCNCHENFCEELAKYLIEQEKRLIYDGLKNKIPKTFVASVNNYINYFREVEKQQLSNAINSFSEGFVYNFINFNYTNTLDKCISITNAQADIWGKRRMGNNTYSNHFGSKIHIHGTCSKDMVLGVNDKSQISDTTLFDDYGEEYINQIIKQGTDFINKENTYQKAYEIIKASDLIYIYGMSIGLTDKLWWDRICTVLKQKGNTHLIIHMFDAPKSGLILRKYTTFEKETRNKFLSNCNLDEKDKKNIINRIHIDGSNIFSGLKDLVKDPANKLEKEAVAAT